MKYKNRTGLPISFFFLSLVLLILAGYYFTGVFALPGVTLDNFEEKLLYVVMHFYTPWKFINQYSILGVVGGLLGWLFFIVYIIDHFRNYRTGEEGGTAEWADIDEYNEKHSDPSLGTDRILGFDARISIEGEKAPSNNNMLVISTSGTYKTTGIAVPNILRCASNIIFLDVKGDTLFKYGNYLEEQGYGISVLSPFHPEESHCYDPFAYMENEMDIEDLIENIYAALEPPDAVKNDPFWTDGPKLYMSALFYYEFYRAQYANETPCLKNAIDLLALETQLDENGRKNKKDQIKTKLEVKMDEFAENNPLKEKNPAVENYRKLKEGASETVRSIVIIVNAKLKLFTVNGFDRIITRDEMNLREFAYGVGGTREHHTNKKKAVFICVDAFNTDYHFIASILYSQVITVLSRIALKEFKDKGSTLPIPLEMWMDEFYTGAKPYNTVNLLGVIRSLNISMILFFQSHAQILDLFQTDKTEIILDNCPVVTFGGCGPTSKGTAEWISDILNNETIDKASDSKQGMNTNVNYDRTGVKLMTPDQVMKMPKDEMIIFTQSEKPLYEKKALPWKLPESVCPFKHALSLNENHPDKGWVNHIEFLESNGTTYEFTNKIEKLNPTDDVTNKTLIDLNSKEFIFGNLEKKENTESVDKFIQNYLSLFSTPEDDTKIVPKSGTTNSVMNSRDVTGTVSECIKKYADELSSAEMSELMLAQASGLSEEDIKTMLRLSHEHMHLYRLGKENNIEF